MTANEAPRSNDGPHLGADVARGAAWASVSNLFTRVANIAMTAVLARLLAPAEFGVFVLALAIFVVLSSLAELGLAAAIARSPSDPSDIAPTVTTVALASSGVLAAAMAWWAADLAVLVGSPDATGPIRILAISVALTGVFAVPGAQLAREFRQRRLFAATVAGFVPANVVLVVLALMGEGAEAFAWSRVAGQLVTGAVMVASVDRIHLPGLRRDLVPGLVWFGLPLAVANLVNWALLNADYVILGRFLTETDVGTYMIAFTVASWSTAVLGSAINSVVVPGLARVGDDPEQVAAAVATGLRLVALVALPVGTCTAVLAHPLVDVLFGQRWAPSAPVLVVLSAYGVLYAFSLLLVNVLVAAGHTGRLLWVQLLWVGVLVPSMVWSIRYGLVGVAWAHVAVMALVALPAHAWVLRDRLPRPLRVLRAVVPAAASALAAGAVALLASRALDTAGSLVSLLAGGGSAVVLYLVLTRRLWRPLVPARSSSQSVGPSTDDQNVSRSLLSPSAE